MIGPHEGQELDLMLLKKKRLSAFCDIVPDDGIIDEEIIPENAFAKHVTQGTIIREEKNITSANQTIRYVCFTLPGEEWRAKAYLFFREKIHMKQMIYNVSLDEIFGHLLDYDQKDIDEFIQQ